MNNPVQWFEIPTTDLERAKSFYSNVINLQFQYIEMPNSKMYMFGEPDKIGSGGSLVQSNKINPSINGTVVYFSCDDIADHLEIVEKEGGKVIVPKTDIRDFGFFAHIDDTEGNRIGLHSNK